MGTSYLIDKILCHFKLLYPSSPLPVHYPQQKFVSIAKREHQSWGRKSTQHFSAERISTRKAKEKSERVSEKKTKKKMLKLCIKCHYFQLSLNVPLQKIQRNKFSKCPHYPNQLPGYAGPSNCPRTRAPYGQLTSLVINMFFFSLFMLPFSTKNDVIRIKEKKSFPILLKLP